jgi:hypothetical protein
MTTEIKLPRRNSLGIRQLYDALFDHEEFICHDIWDEKLEDGSIVTKCRGQIIIYTKDGRSFDASIDCELDE